MNFLAVLRRFIWSAWFPSVLEIGLYVHLIGLVLWLLKFDRECESRTFLILRLKVDLAIELINYLFGNEETKTTPILVKSLIVLGLIIDLEEVVLVFFLYAYASVLDWTLEVFVFIYLDDVNEMFDFAVLSVLDGIWLETVKHLQYSLLVWVHHQSVIVGEVFIT